ncbi:MAG: NUDIX hydrolase [Chitinophagales bacterium]
MDKPWKPISKQIVYDNPWITVSHEDVIAPTGHEGIYGKVHYKNYAIGILPLDEEYNTWLVGQHRYPIDEYSWEMPEGGGLVGQDILTAAKRELREEVGLEAKNWQEIQRIHLSNSVSDELGVLFIATGLSTVPKEPDETEVLQIKKVSFEEAFRMVWENEITDTMTIIAILRTKRMIEEGVI